MNTWIRSQKLRRSVKYKGMSMPIIKSTEEYATAYNEGIDAMLNMGNQLFSSGADERYSRVLKGRLENFETLEKPEKKESEKVEKVDDNRYKILEKGYTDKELSDFITKGKIDPREKESEKEKEKPKDTTSAQIGGNLQHIRDYADQHNISYDEAKKRLREIRKGNKPVHEGKYNPGPKGVFEKIDKEIGLEREYISKKKRAELFKKKHEGYIADEKLNKANSLPSQFKEEEVKEKKEKHENIPKPPTTEKHEGKQTYPRCTMLGVQKTSSVPMFESKDESARVFNAVYGKVSSGGKTRAVLVTPKWDVERWPEAHLVVRIPGTDKNPEIIQRKVPEWQFDRETAYCFVDGSKELNLSSTYAMTTLGATPKKRFACTIRGIDKWGDDPVISYSMTTNAMLTEGQIRHDMSTIPGDCGNGLYEGDRCVGLHYIGDVSCNKAIPFTQAFLEKILGNGS